MAQDTPSNFKMFAMARSPRLKHRAQAVEHAVDEVMLRRMLANAKTKVERFYNTGSLLDGAVVGTQVASAREYPAKDNPNTFTLLLSEREGKGAVRVLVGEQTKPKVYCTPEAMDLGQKIAAEIEKVGKFITRIEVIVGDLGRPKKHEFF